MRVNCVHIHRLNISVLLSSRMPMLNLIRLSAKTLTDCVKAIDSNSMFKTINKNQRYHDIQLIQMRCKEEEEEQVMIWLTLFDKRINIYLENRINDILNLYCKLLGFYKQTNTQINSKQTKKHEKNELKSNRAKKNQFRCKSLRRIISHRYVIK